jgi:hypothetical protein
MSGLRWQAAVVTLLCLAATARAHEPLWSENASTVGPKVWHWDLRGGHMASGPLKSGTRLAPNPTGLREMADHQMLMADYGITSSLNVRAMIDRTRMTQSEIQNGVQARRSTGGWGDLQLGAKYRFKNTLLEGQKDQHTALFMVSLPTGSTNEQGLHGRHAPSDQPGAGKVGLHLGYAYNHEWLKDTVWLSAAVDTYPGGGFRRGTRAEVSGAYGHWVKYANRPQDLAAILALGFLYERDGKDHDDAGPLADTGGESFGWHLTALVTRVPWMVRAGVYLPAYRRVNGTQVADGPEFRLGVEVYH